jgi:hypothetical protein
MMTVAPDHFFRRIPQIEHGVKPIYKKPTAFLVESTAQAIFAIKVVLPHFGISITDTSIRFALLVFALFSPVLIVLLSGVSAGLISRFPAFGSGIFQDEVFAQFSAILKMRRGLKFDSGIYWRGIVALSVYLWFAVPATLLLFWGTLTLLPSETPRIVEELALLPAAATCCVLILRPYLSLLRAATRLPTLELMDCDIQKLNDVLLNRKEQDAEVIVRDFSNLWMEFRFRIRSEELYAAKLDGILPDCYRLCRAMAYRSLNMDAVAKLIDTMRFMAMPIPTSLRFIQEEVGSIQKGGGIFLEWTAPLLNESQLFDRCTECEDRNAVTKTIRKYLKATLPDYSARWKTPQQALIVEEPIPAIKKNASAR